MLLKLRPVQLENDVKTNQNVSKMNFFAISPLVVLLLPRSLKNKQVVVVEM